MAKKKKSKLSGADNPFGPLNPQPDDVPLKPTDTAESVMSRVQLACDDNTGVFFFRHSGKLFMRVVEFG